MGNNNSDKMKKSHYGNIRRESPRRRNWVNSWKDNTYDIILRINNHFTSNADSNLTEENPKSIDPSKYTSSTGTRKFTDHSSLRRK